MTAYAKELVLQKEQTSYSDLIDSLRLSLKAYNITEQKKERSSLDYLLSNRGTDFRRDYSL
jgi:hypothetical protein